MKAVTIIIIISIIVVVIAAISITIWLVLRARARNRRTTNTSPTGGGGSGSSDDNDGDDTGNGDGSGDTGSGDGSGDSGGGTQTPPLDPCDGEDPVITGASIVNQNWPSNTEFQLNGDFLNDINILGYEWEILGEDIGGINVVSSGSSSITNILTKTGNSSYSIDWSAANANSCQNLNDGYTFGCYNPDPGSGCDFGNNFTVGLLIRGLTVQNDCGNSSVAYCLELRQLCGDPPVGAPFNADDGPPAISITLSDANCTYI